MWNRAAAAVLVLTAVGLCTAQTPETYSRALPPDRMVLDRLNLKTEWALNLPVTGTRDTIALVQTIDDQLFVQTRLGLLIAIDVRTGQIQWSANLGNGTSANVYRVGANSQFVYVVRVTKLFCFYRYTGVTEFAAELSRPQIRGFGGAPIRGPVADESGVYLVLGASPGSAGTERVAAYNLPRPIPMADAAKLAALKPIIGGDPKLTNPVEEVVRRYPLDTTVRVGPVESFEPSQAGAGPGQAGGMTSTRSPSLAAMPRISPPYTLRGQPTSPSIQIVPSLRQPYHLRNSSNQDIQRTPSLATIPPSVASALALTDLRPRGIEPTMRWEYALTARIIYPVVLTPTRVWAITDARAVRVLSKVDRQTEMVAGLQDQVAAPPGQAGTIGYFPLADGNLLAIDLLGGTNEGGVNQLWRVNVGGFLDHVPLVTRDAVFPSGDHSGVARVNRDTGELVWRTESGADLLLAVNEEFAYVRDRQGRLLIYDARRATDPLRHFSLPLTGVNFPEFNVPVVNTVSDRLFLAADNGLIVCLRDASAKYARPVRMAPEVSINPLPKEALKKDGMPPPTPEAPAAPDAPPAPVPAPKKAAPAPKKPGN